MLIKLLSILTLHCHFSLVKFKGMKINFLWKFIIEDVDIFSKVTRNTSHKFNHLGLLQCKIPVDFFIFSNILKSDKLGGVSKEKLRNVHPLELTLFEP